MVATIFVVGFDLLMAGADALLLISGGSGFLIFSRFLLNIGAILVVFFTSGVTVFGFWWVRVFFWQGGAELSVCVDFITCLVSCLFSNIGANLGFSGVGGIIRILGSVF